MNLAGNDYDDETSINAKESAKNFLESNYHGINSIELEEPYTSPMGSMTIEGKVNKEVGFTITLDDDLVVSGIGTNEGFPEVKEECKEKMCDY